MAARSSYGRTARPTRGGRMKRTTSRHLASARAAYRGTSIMNLPVELRLQILSYLLPDVATVTHVGSFFGQKNASRDYFHTPTREERLQGARYDQESTRFDRHQISSAGLYQSTEKVIWPLRKDCEPCTVSVLRVNKQLYNDGISIMYNRSFEFYLNERSLSFRDWSVSMDADTDIDRIAEELCLPMQQIRSLEIVIKAKDDYCGCYDPAGGDAYVKTKDSINNLAVVLEKWPLLSRLTIDFVDEELRQAYDVDGRLLRFVQPFARIRGLMAAELMVQSKAVRDVSPATQLPDGHVTFSKLISDMKSHKPRPARIDRPQSKRNFNDAIGAARKIGVQSFDLTPFHDLGLYNQYYEDGESYYGSEIDNSFEIQYFQYGCWYACDQGLESMMQEAYKAIERACDEHLEAVLSARKEVRRLLADVANR